MSKKDADGRDWKVPTAEVDRLVHEMFDRFYVWRLYADPPYWQEWVAKWMGELGEDRVIEWYTNRDRQMSFALEGFDAAIKEGHVTHAGDPNYLRHLGNARKRPLHQVDERGQARWVISKDRSDSPHKIDVAMAGVLSWQARTDAIAEGVDGPVPEPELMVVSLARH
jgi:phage terminase large subunit-like protein